VPDEPAFMMIGRVPPWGFGLARMPASLKNCPSKSKSPPSDQARLTTSTHSCAKCVARFMIALCDPEHFELAFIPAGNDVEPEATFADLVAGDAFLGGDDGIEQWGMDGTEYGDALVAASRPAAQVLVSSVSPWKSVSPP